MRQRKVQEFEISDAVWELIEPLIPQREKKVHPLGCHRPRVPDRQVLNGIFFVLLCAANRVSMEGTGCNRHLLRLNGSRTVSGMAASRLLRVLVGDVLA